MHRTWVTLIPGLGDTVSSCFLGFTLSCLRAVTQSVLEGGFVVLSQAPVPLRGQRCATTWLSEIQTLSLLFSLKEFHSASSKLSSKVSSPYSPFLTSSTHFNHLRGTLLLIFPPGPLRIPTSLIIRWGPENIYSNFLARTEFLLYISSVQEKYNASHNFHWKIHFSSAQSHFEWLHYEQPHVASG